MLGDGTGASLLMSDWHLTDYDPHDVVNLSQISQMSGIVGEISYDALRSYATGRRTHVNCGPMPDHVARVANRRLWLRIDIELWILPLSIPKWRRPRYSPVRDG